MRHFIFCCFFTPLLGVAFAGLAHAAELRVLDTGGLIRAAKVTRENAKIVVRIQSDGRRVTGECVAVNIDGLAAEKKVTISSGQECVFLDVPVGSWQIAVPSGVQWRAQIYE